MLPVTGWPPYRPQVENIQILAPGNSRGLDLICDGILLGRDFVYPAEAVEDVPDRSSLAAPTAL
jgi:hypothetical protein